MQRGPHNKKQSERRSLDPAASNGKVPVQGRAARPVPFFKLLLFYAVLIGIGALLSYWFPLVRDAWITSAVVGSGQKTGDLFNGVTATGGVLHENIVDRALVTMLITLGALAVSLPVAWTYTFTRRLRYDPS